MQEKPTTELREAGFYISSKPRGDENLNDYDAVLFTVCDVFGRPRGKFAYGKNIQRLAREGMETPHTSSKVRGNIADNTQKPPEKQGKETCISRDTQRGKRGSEDEEEGGSYVSKDGTIEKEISRRIDSAAAACKALIEIGHVLCDLYDTEGRLYSLSPRSIALQQLQNLKTLGFTIMTAFETEFILYHKGTLDPLGGDRKELTNMVRLDTDIPFLYDHMMGLLASGIPAETQMEESVPGQIEYSMQPLHGIKMADAVHRLRYVTKSLCERAGFDQTFMTKPKFAGDSSGFHFNHSLWTLDGRNAFYDPDDSHHCSDILWHWVAGIIRHGDALAALMNPTVNCYERLHNTLTPNDNNWNYNDRYAHLRVKTKSKNIHIEDRMPSSACNPYLSLAGLIAAGADGIARQLEAPPPRAYRPPNPESDSPAKVANPLPKTLEEALGALEQDTVLTRAIGEDFIKEYIALCKEFQLEKLQHLKNKDPEEIFQAERDLFLYTL